MRNRQSKFAALRQNGAAVFQTRLDIRQAVRTPERRILHLEIDEGNQRNRAVPGAPGKFNVHARAPTRIKCRVPKRRLAVKLSSQKWQRCSLRKIAAAAMAATCIFS